MLALRSNEGFHISLCIPPEREEYFYFYKGLYTGYKNGPAKRPIATDRC